MTALDVEAEVFLDQVIEEAMAGPLSKPSAVKMFDLPNPGIKGRASTRETLRRALRAIYLDLKANGVESDAAHYLLGRYAVGVTTGFRMGTDLCVLGDRDAD